MKSAGRGADLTLRSLGAADTVTGSKHLLEAGGRRILLDCGLFQGVKNLRELNWAPLAVEPSSVDAVILSHAHLDHCGYLPRLVREGFTGPIVSTAATAAVAEIILRDSAYLQERDAAFLNKHKASKHHPALPPSDSEDTERPKVSFDVGETVKINDGPFLNFTGVIEELEPDKGKLKVTVDIFGRKTPVELEYWQVEKS